MPCTCLTALTNGQREWKIGHFGDSVEQGLEDFQLPEWKKETYEGLCLRKYTKQLCALKLWYWKNPPTKTHPALYSNSFCQPGRRHFQHSRLYRLLTSTSTPEIGTQPTSIDWMYVSPPNGWFGNCGDWNANYVISCLKLCLIVYNRDFQFMYLWPLLNPRVTERNKNFMQPQGVVRTEK